MTEDLLRSCIGKQIRLKSRKLHMPVEGCLKIFNSLASVLIIQGVTYYGINMNEIEGEIELLGEAG